MVGLTGYPDWKQLSQAESPAAHVVILGDLSYRTLRPDNGVIATRSLTFRDTKAYLTRPELGGQFERDVILGIMALLRVYPEADAYWLYLGGIPALLRRGGRLVLAQQPTENNRYWDRARQPYRDMVDLPYVVEPLGPWRYVPNEAYVPEDPVES